MMISRFAGVMGTRRLDVHDADCRAVARVHKGPCAMRCSRDWCLESVGRDLEFLHEARVLRIVLAKQAVESFNAAADRFQRLFRETLAHGRIGYGPVGFGVEPNCDRIGGSRRQEHADPLLEHQPFETLLLEGRDVRQSRRALRCRLRQQLQGPGLVMRDEWRRSERADLHMAGDEVVQGWSTPAIRHMRELDAGKRGKPLGGYVLLRSYARGRKAHAGLLFG